MPDEILDQASQSVATPEKEQRRTRWLLWLQWVVVNAVGWAFLAWARGQSPDEPLGLAVLGLGLVCVVLGQWLVLRPRLAHAGWWLLVTPVGVVPGGLATLFAIVVAYGWPGLGLLATLLIGTPLGLLQWFVLRGRMRRALWWLPVTVVAIGTSFLVLWLCLPALAQRPVDWADLVLGGFHTADLATTLGGFVGGAVYGAVTGAALAIFLPSPIQARDRKRLPSRLVVGIALLSLLAICLGWGFLGEPVNVRHMLVQRRLGRHDFFGLRLQGADLSGADLRNADLRNADLRGADLRYADLRNADLRYADLSDANLAGANLTDAFLGNTGYGHADLSNADLTDANLTNARLGEVDLSGADLSGADLRWASLSRAKLSEANLRKAKLLLADLSGANLIGADLTDADLTGADLRGARLDDSTQLDEKPRLVWSILNEGGAGRDLGEADLSGAELSEANLRKADLSGANLSHAELYQAKLEGACLHGASLCGA